MRTSLVVVDDDPGFRARARMLLEAGGFDVVGEAGDAAQAHELVRTLHPQAVLVDVGLPDVDGLTLATQLHGAQLHGAVGPHRVVVMSGRDASDYGPRVDDCGAVGFLAKIDLTAESLRELLDGSHA
jgi:DNA-binding NarL/FixJ family response regulator